MNLWIKLLSHTKPCVASICDSVWSLPTLANTSLLRVASLYWNNFGPQPRGSLFIYPRPGQSFVYWIPNMKRAPYSENETGSRDSNYVPGCLGTPWCRRVLMSTYYYGTFTLIYVLSPPGARCGWASSFLFLLDVTHPTLATSDKG